MSKTCRKIRRIMSAFVVLVIGGLASTAMAAPLKELRFGLLPAEDAVEMTKQFQGIADHLGKALGLPTKVSVSQSYNALIEALAAGKLEIVYLGANQYVAAKLQGLNVVPLVVAKTPIAADDKVGRTYYKACIITLGKSGIKTVNDLKGKTFAFVSPTSTSGGVGPRYYLVKNGINPERDFKDLVYAGKHDSVYLAVKNGKVDAGGTGDVYFPRWKARGILEYTEYDEPNDTLKESPIHIIGCAKVLGTVMVARGDLGQETIKKIQEAFASLPIDAVDAYRIWGPTLAFVRISHEDFRDSFEMKKIVDEVKKKQ